MVVDSSALLAILLGEPERRDLNERIEADPHRLISAANLLEAAIVLESRSGEIGGRELDLFLHRAGFETVSVDDNQVAIARSAFRKYGKGRHPASLNFGDCFAYAASKATGEPLLFKGSDFMHTDIVAAAPTGL